LSLTFSFLILIRTSLLKKFVFSLQCTYT